MLPFTKAVCIMVVAAVIAHYLLHNNASPIVRDLTTPITDISELIAHASQYDGKVVKVEGKVVGSAGLMGLGGYRLQQDGSSETILIVSRSGVPSTGVAVSVSGTFRQALSVNSYAYPVILRDF